MDEMSQVINLRALGLSSNAISDQVGLSVRTVQRICKTKGVTKGELSDEILAEGRERLREHALSDERVKDAIAAHLLDEMAQVKALREKCSEVFDSFNPNHDRDRAVFMRSAVAYSTMLKNTSDIMRRATDLDRFREESMVENMPELVVAVMDEVAVREERARQREQARELGFSISDEDLELTDDHAADEVECF
jgi:hypothetical protein